MDPLRWETIQELFLEVREYPVQEREAFLRDKCKDDEDLYREVVSLLEADQSANNFLDQSPVNPIEIDKLLSLSGQRAGAYRILKEIGKGGMGSVYLAQREDGQFNQKVALKVINPGMDSREILKRFQNERQITARLQHPNIARLFDGGLTENGLPFFTMEYIDGQPINEYCKTNNISLPEKLALFIETCQAVQYAHQNLVIHRDLKPSNILVEKTGSVKLLDFGIAKVLDTNDESSAEDNLTRTGMRVMSPAYASPEQVRGESVSISTDIYSLGVVLYKLLTDQLPYDVSSLSPTEIERQVCNTEPEKPSRLVARSIDESANPNFTKKLSKKLKGDLDNICHKALQKELDRRYHSAEHLADDIRQYLSGNPIMARKDTLIYKTSKFIGRNRGRVLSAGIILLLTTFLISYYTIQLTVERNLARQEAMMSTEITDFLMSLFQVSDPGFSRGESLTARELLERGSLRIEDELSDQPENQARLMHVLGQVYYTLGMYKESKQMIEGAIKHGRIVLDDDDPQIGKYMSTLSWLLDLENNLDSAELLELKVLQININHFGENSLEVGKSYHELATTSRHRGDFEGADSLYLKALTIKKSLPEIDDIELAHTLNHYARLLYQRGDLAGSVPVYKEALEKRENALGRDHPETVASMAGLAGALTKLDELEQAEMLYRECLAAVKKTSGMDHPYYGGLLSSIANVLFKKEDYRQSEEYYRRAIAKHRQVYPEKHAKISNPLLGLGILLNKTEREIEGLIYLNEATDIRRNSLGDSHWLTGNAKIALGECLSKLGEYQQAETNLIGGYENLKTTFDNENKYVSRALDRIIELYNSWGKKEKAGEYLSIRENLEKKNSRHYESDG